MKTSFVVKKKTYSHKEKILLKSNFSELDAKVNLFVGALNTIAGRAASEAKDMLYKRKELWKHEIKYNARKTIAAIEKNERNFTTNFGDRYNLFLDYLNNVEDDFEKPINMLGLQIQQLLTKNNQSYAHLKAKVELARTLLEYACLIFDRLMAIAEEETGYDFKQVYADRRLTEAYHYWCNVTSKICVTDNDTYIDLNSDPNCKLAFKIIEQRLADEDTLNRAGFEALKANPDLVKKSLCQEEYEELKKKFENNNN